LGIFLPALSEKGIQAQATKLTVEALNDFNPADLDVKFLVNLNFLKQCGPSVNIVEDDGMISTYDPSIGDHTQIQGLMHLNLQSVAKVCDTDMLTVEAVLKEIVA
jgi:hypothetical protein